MTFVLWEDKSDMVVFLSGISAELHSLHARTYTSSGNPAFPSSSKYVGKTCNENVGEQVVVLADNVDGEIQVPSNLSVLTEPSSCKDAGDCDAQERVVSQPDLPQQEPLDNNTHNSTQEIDGRITADAHVVSSNFVGGVKVLTDSCIEVSCIHENHKSDASYVKSDDACMPTREQPVHESNELKEMNDEATVLSKNGPFNNFTSMEDADSGRIHNDITIATVNDDPAFLAENSFLANGADRLDNGATPHPIDSSSHDKDETCLQVDPCVLPGDENLSVPDVMMEFVEPNSATINGQQDVEQDKEDFLDVGPGDNAFQEQLFFNEEHPSALGVHEEMTEKASSSPFHTVDETENFPSTVGENSGFRVLNIEGVMDDESTPMDFSTVIESSVRFLPEPHNLFLHDEYSYSNNFCYSANLGMCILLCLAFLSIFYLLHVRKSGTNFSLVICLAILMHAFKFFYSQFEVLPPNLKF